MDAITLGRNISSLRAQRRLAESTGRLSSSLERLSSGARINGASDDAAGLSVSEKLRVDSRLYSQAIKNINDGASTLSIAGTALGQLSGITIRQQELAQQSANGVFSAKQRQAIEREAQELTKEYNRIILTTSFNEQKLLDGSMDLLTLQAGVTSDSCFSLAIGRALSRPVDATGQTTTKQNLESGGAAETVYDIGWAVTAERYTLEFPDAFDVPQNQVVIVSSSGSLHDFQMWGTTDWFSLTSGAESYYVWMDPGGGVDPTPDGYTAGIRVAVDGLTTEDAEQCIANALNDNSHGWNANFNGSDIELTFDNFRSWVTGNSNFVGMTETQSAQSSPFIGSKVQLYTPSGAGYLWFSLDTNGADAYGELGSDPGGDGYGTQVNIWLGWDSQAVAAAAAAAVLEFGFSVVSLNGTTLVVEANENGNAASTGTSFATISQTDGGAFDIQPGDYFSFNAGDGSEYSVWYQVDGAGGAPGSGTPISVAISSSDSLSDVAIATRNAINLQAGSQFTASATGTEINILNDSVGAGGAASTNMGDKLAVSSVSGGWPSGFDPATDKIEWTGHGIETGQLVTLNTVYGTLPTGLVEGDYYAIKSDADHLKLATSLSNAQSGTAVNFSDNGSGLHRLSATVTSTVVSGRDATITAPDLSTAEAVRSSMSGLSQQLERIQGEINALGAFESRLSAALSTIYTSRENCQAAASRIMDVDIASESAQAAKENILQQVASAILAQSNRAPELALSLLRNG